MAGKRKVVKAKAGSWRDKYQGYQQIGQYHRALQAAAAARGRK